MDGLQTRSSFSDSDRPDYQDFIASDDVSTIDSNVNPHASMEDDLTTRSTTEEKLKSEDCVNSSKRLSDFRRAVLVVQFVRNMIKLYRDYAASRAELLSFSELTTAVMMKKSDSLLFDISHFKATNEREINNEVKTILSSPPQNRTREGIKLATLSLRTAVDTFAEYPIHMQEKLAQVGWYESFGPGRVIIREGHVPQNFYLILSGTALVTKTSINRQTGEPFVRTAAFLKKGKTFGDVAILNGARRNATVLCHNTVSLLSVPRQDFINMFMSHEANEEQNFITFLRKIEVLSGWPVGNLPDNKPGICIHTFFRRNTVISRDTKASSKIYIIKTGTIRVLKTLTSTKPHLPGKPSSISGDWKYQNTDNQSEEMHAKKAVRIKTSLPSRKSSRDVEFLLPLLQQGPAAFEERADTPSPYTSSATVPKEASSTIHVEEDGSHIYIHVQTLKPGDVFGLVYLLFEDTFGMTLISEGAECILISKDFFKKYTDDAYLCKLSKVVQPYPSEQALQKQLQEYINWSAYKSLLFNRQQKLCAISK